MMKLTNFFDCMAVQFWQTVNLYPNKIAIVDANNTYTYIEFSEKVNSLAHDLIALKQDNAQANICAIYIDHSSDMLVAIMASIIAGYGYQPIDTSFPKERVETLLVTSQPTVILSTSSHQAIVHNIANVQSNWIEVDKVRPKNDIPRICAKVNKRSAAYMLSTSGTSGTAKSILHSRQSLIRGVCHYINDLNIVHQDRIALVLPYTYTPSIFSIFGALSSGASLHLFDLKKQSIEEMLTWLESSDISLLYCSPTIFRRITSQYSKEASRLSLRGVQLAGEVLFSSDILDWQNNFSHLFSLYNGMGTTETGCLTRYFIDPSLAPTESRAPIGKPYEDLSYSIIDDHGQAVEPGEVGELCVQGDFIPTGYYKNDELSHGVFISDGGDSGDSGDSDLVTYKTGDRVKQSASGDLIHLGRIDGQVKLRGQRVELSEIESKILSTGLADEAAVFYHEDTELPFISAFFQPENNIGAMRKKLCQVLPPYMIPTRIVSMDKLPTNASGKLDRFALKNYNFSTSSKVTEDALGDDLIELKLIEAFQNVLSASKVSVNTNFFELGGDSLKAVELSIAIQESLFIPLNVSTLIESPTPKLLAENVKEILYSNRSSKLVCLNNEHNKTASNSIPLFCLPGLSGDAFSFRALANEINSNREVYSIEYPGFNGEEITYRKLDELVNICFDEISTQYPTGPLALVAHSLGGIVAFELCRKFESAGREVKSLTMLDCYSPNYMKLRHLRELVCSLFEKAIGIFKSTDESNSTLKKIDERNSKANFALTSAVFKYKPKAFSTPNALLIIAKDQIKVLDIYDNYKQWDVLFNNKLDKIEVSGDHTSLIKASHAVEMATLIESRLSTETNKKKEKTQKSTSAIINDIWRFNEQGLLRPQPVSANKTKSIHFGLLNKNEQLTKHLEAYVNDQIVPLVLSSEQRGRFYYRKVALRTQKENKLIAIAAIRIAMDVMPKDAREDVLSITQPFGRILTKFNIDYQCQETTVFETPADQYLSSEFTLEAQEQSLLGRKNQFKTSDGHTLADVVEILSPWA